MKKEASDQQATRRGVLRLGAAGFGVAALGGLLNACGAGGGGSDGPAVDAGVTPVAKTDPPCDWVSYPLIMGQTEVVGALSINNIGNLLLVEYEIDRAKYPDCRFGKLHVWAGKSLADLPKGGDTRPPPGLLPYHVDASGKWIYQVQIPLADLGLNSTADWCKTKQKIYVVAHAEVLCPGRQETAFGGNTAGGGRAWWFYGTFTPCCQ